MLEFVELETEKWARNNLLKAESDSQPEAVDVIALELQLNRILNLLMLYYLSSRKLEFFSILPTVDYKQQTVSTFLQCIV